MNMRWLLFFALVSIGSGHGSVHLIIFSFDRPLQLYALLESAHTYVSSLETVSVIYRFSNQHYQMAYEQVKTNFLSVQYYAQMNPPADFKMLTLQCVQQSNCPYLMFAVDDIVVKDYVDLSECVCLLEQYQAYGFFLRLGTHLQYCYSTYSDQSVPPFLKDSDGICVWNFADGQWDWSYPHSLDMTIYRAADIMPWLESLEYHNPNQLEHYLATCGSHGPRGICYQNSKIINLPINIVQTYTHNNSVHSYSPEQLLAYFNDGLKLDTRHLYQVKNSACHMFDAQILFVPRS